MSEVRVSMQIEEPCPECGKRRFDASAREEMLQVLNTLGVDSCFANPGGALFIFKTGAELQTHGLCYNCDLDTVRLFAQSVPAPPAEEKR